MNVKFKNYANFWKQAVPFPKTKIKKARQVCRNLSLSLISKIPRSNKSNFLRCLYCHYVFDDQKERFNEILKSLSNVGQFVTTDVCIQMLKEGNINGKYFHLSFDDGFRNIYKNAYPVLRKHKIPSIAFLPTDFIDVDWAEEKKYCLDIAKYNGVIETLKWNDILEMSSNNVDFGSHTRTHVNLSSISNNELLLNNEIKESKKDLEEKIGKDCKYIAWPFGEHKHIDNTAIDYIKESQYTACFGAFRGSIHKNKTDIFKIPRHHFEVEWPINHIQYFADTDHGLC